MASSTKKPAAAAIKKARPSSSSRPPENKQGNKQTRPKKQTGNKQSGPLPPPVDAPEAQPAAELPKPDQGGGLFGNLFLTESKQGREPEQQPSPAASAAASSISSTPISEPAAPAGMYFGVEMPPLSEEARRILASVPDTIGDAAAAPARGSSAAAVDDQDDDDGAAELLALADAISFTPETVAKMLEMATGFIDRKMRGQGTLALDGSEALTMGAPFSKTVNHAWELIKAKLPSWLSRASSTIPGVTETLGLALFIYFPKALEFSKVRATAAAPAPAGPRVVEGIDMPPAAASSSADRSGGRLRYPAGMGPRA